MNKLFLYDTLQQTNEQQKILGHKLTGKKDTLPDYKIDKAPHLTRYTGTLQ